MQMTWNRSNPTSQGGEVSVSFRYLIEHAAYNYLPDVGSEMHVVTDEICSGETTSPYSCSKFTNEGMFLPLEPTGTVEPLPSSCEDSAFKMTINDVP